MNALEDTRELVTAVATDDARAERGLYAHAASSAVFALLVDYPDVELATLQFHIDSDDPPKITVTGRRGPLVPALECPQCHQPIGRPHTEFCTLAPDRIWPEHAIGTPCRCHLVRDGSREAWGNPGPWHAQDCPRWTAGAHLVASEAFIDQDDPRSHPVGRRSQPGAHHAEDCPMRLGLVTTGCICGREGERDPASNDCPCSYSAGPVEHSALCPSFFDSQP